MWKKLWRRELELSCLSLLFIRVIYALIQPTNFKNNVDEVIAINKTLRGSNLYK